MGPEQRRSPTLRAKTRRTQLKKQMSAQRALSQKQTVRRLLCPWTLSLCQKERQNTQTR